MDAATNGNTAATQFSTVYDATTPDSASCSLKLTDIHVLILPLLQQMVTLVFIGTAEADSSLELFINNTSVRN